MKLIRYLCYLWILILIIKHTKGLLVMKWGVPFYALFLYFILIGILSIPGFLHYGLEGFMHYKQFFVFLLIVNAFYYYPKLTGKNYDSLVTNFVYIGTAFSVINLILYFLRPSFINITFIDRFSAGYPTVDVVPLAFCLMTCLIYEDLKMGRLSRLICSIILLISLFSQFSGSGTVFLILIILGVCFYCMKSKRKKENIVASNFRLFIISVCALLFAGFTYLINAFPIIVEESIPVLENRLLTLVGKNDESSLSINTAEMRKDQFNKSFKYYYDDLIWGSGYGPVTVDEKNRDKVEYVFIENQYKHNIIAVGYIGAFIFVFFVLMDLYKSLRSRDIFSCKVLYVLSGLLYILGSNNICTLDILQSFVPFCLYWAIRENRLVSSKKMYFGGRLK